MASYGRYSLRIRGTSRVDNYPLPYGRTLIGYDPACDVLLDDRTVSGRHALIFYNVEDENCKVTDLGGPNQTLLDDEPLPANREVPMQLNQRIQIGSYTLTLEQYVAPQMLPLAATRPTTLTQRRNVASDPYAGAIPPGLSRYSVKLLQFLPTIYQPTTTDYDRKVTVDDLEDRSPETFFARFLALFEATLLPIQWVIENFDLYLDAHTTPPEFMPWLENWYGLPVDAQLRDDPAFKPQRLQLLLHAHELYELKGTHYGLVKLLEICTKCQVEIADQTQPGAFVVTIHTPPANLDRALIERLIVAFKPVDVTYELIFER